jgi:Uma2 family endonuclease
MLLPAKKIERKYTYQDYLSWNNDERYEIIDGVVYDMSPAPTTKHQRISGLLFARLLATIEKNSKCRVFMSPTDVILSEDDVVQPDIFVVCDEKKITDKNISGSPDLIFEILSPSTAIKDITIKKITYEKFGVKEYVIVHPSEMYIEQFVIEKNDFILNAAYSDQDILKLKIFKDVEIPLWEIFEVEKIDRSKIEEPKVT